MKSDALLEATILALQGKLLKEANPSNLKKLKNKDRNIHYEPSEGDYEHIPFDYKLSGNNYQGTIQDKKGNQYKVSAEAQEKDTGSIAGGTYYFYVTIFYDNHQISLTDYTAVFSRNEGPGSQLLSDIKEGIYLEDYLQKYIKYINNVSNIEDWIKMKKDSGESMSSYQYTRQWVEENVINENNDYDARTSLDKKIDKRNENIFVSIWQDANVYIDDYSIKLAEDYNMARYLYTAGKGSDKYRASNESITVPKGTEIVFSDSTKENIYKQIDSSKYNVNINLNELSDIIFTLGPMYSVFKYNKNKLNVVYKDFKFETINVRYYPRIQINKNNKLNELMSQAKIDLEDAPKRVYNIYKEIQSRIDGIKEAKVEIVYDRNELRAKGNDGIHGDAWVQFPKDLRQYGKVYKVDQLIWNGKNYRVKGNIEEIK